MASDAHGDPVSGVVVAGGRSRRFGAREKALAPVAGTPMLRRVVDRLAPAVSEVIVDCRPDQRPAFEAALADARGAPRVVTDAPPDHGPVAGLRAGLADADCDRCVAVACDLPTLPTTLVEALVATLRRRASAGADAVVPTPDDRRQPLCAVYDAAAAREAADAVLSGGEASLRRLLDQLSVVTVAAATVASHASPAGLRNVNTPADLAAVERRL